MPELLAMLHKESKAPIPALLFCVSDAIATILLKKVMTPYSQPRHDIDMFLK